MLAKLQALGTLQNLLDEMLRFSQHYDALSQITSGRVDYAAPKVSTVLDF